MITPKHYQKLLLCNVLLFCSLTLSANIDQHVITLEAGIHSILQDSLPNRVAPEGTPVDKNLFAQFAVPVSDLHKSSILGVQVGIFDDLSIANRTIDEVGQQIQVPIFLKMEFKNGQPKYKVVAGQFENEDDAQKLIYRLKKLGVKGELHFL